MVDLVQQLREGVEKKYSRESLETMLAWAADEIERLRRDRGGWQHTALALRDAAISWEKDGVSRYERIERMYFDAAMAGRFTETYHDKPTEDAELA